MTVAIVLVVRVKDWPAEKKSPPWEIGMAICAFCEEKVVVTPGYAEMLKRFGFRVKYICTQCSSEQRVAA